VRVARVLFEGHPKHCLIYGDQLQVLAGGMDGVEPTGLTIPRSLAEFLPPVEPTKVLAVLGAFPNGRSREVARQTGPRFTSKLTSSLIAHRQVIVEPFDTPYPFDGEAELGVVISRDVRRVDPEDARDAILGFTLVNDVTLAGQGRQDGDFLRPPP